MHHAKEISELTFTIALKKSAETSVATLFEVSRFFSGSATANKGAQEEAENDLVRKLRVIAKA